MVHKTSPGNSKNAKHLFHPDQTEDVQPGMRGCICRWFPLDHWNTLEHWDPMKGMMCGVLPMINMTGLDVIDVPSFLGFLSHPLSRSVGDDLYPHYIVG